MTQTTSSAKPWRRGSFVPHRGIAPTVDLDEGDVNFVLIQARTPADDAMATMVRGYNRRECPFHADVLELAVRPLVSAVRSHGSSNPRPSPDRAQTEPRPSLSPSRMHGQAMI